MPGRWSWFLLPALILAGWPWLAWSRAYDPDEFEHLHAGWCVAKGLTPYRDFFEHHGPLTYYLLAPLVAWIGETPHLLTSHRALNGLWLVVGLSASPSLFRARVLPCHGVALTWLLTFPWFLEKAVEGRPDVPAMALMAWGAWLTMRAARARSAASAVFAGAVMGTASLFTQKTIFLSVGLGIGGALTKAANGRSPKGSILLGAVGFLLPWTIAWWYFDRLGAGEAFLTRTLLTPATWPPHAKNLDEFLLHRLTNVVSWAPGHLAILAAVVWVEFLRYWSPIRWRRGDGVLWCGLVAHLLGAPFVPAYLQYFLLAAPVAAVLVGRTLPPLLRSRGLLTASFVSAAITLAAVPRLRELFGVRAGPYSIVDGSILAALVVVMVLLARCRLRRGLGRRRWATAVVLVSLGPGAGRYAIYHGYWAAAHAQRQELAEFGELSPGPVLDGFSGLGCLRPHASYWWWINHHSLPLIRKEGALQGVLELVRAQTPAVVVFDDGVQRVGGGIDSLLVQGYEHVPFHRRHLFVRRGPSNK